MRLLASVLLLLPLVGAVSCRSAPPADLRPPLPLPAAFTDTGTRRLPPRWWEDFGDPELDRLVGEALGRNFDLRTFWDRLAQLAAIARREGAARDVQLDVTAGGQVGGVRTVAGLADANQLGLGAAATYELDLWGRLEAREQAALLDVEAGGDELRTAAITLSAAVAATWYSLVEQRRQVELLTEQIATNEQVLDLITVRFRQGQFGAADVLRQQQLVEARRGDRVEAESRAEVLENELAVLIGRPPGGLLSDESAKLVDLPALPDTGVPARLVERRPDVREAYHRILAADRRVAEAVADRYPRFSLAGAAGTSNAKLGDLFTTWFADLALDAFLPILDGGRRAAEVDRTRAVVSERINDYGAVILDALREVDDALVQERRQRELIESLVRQLELSQSVLDRLRERAAKGAVNYLDVLQALVSRQSLERNRLAAERQLIGYRIDLCRALAGGWEMERPEPEELRTADRGRPGEDRAGS